MQDTKAIASYECMNACIVNHMRQAGVNVSGSDIYFAGAGYPITYRKGSLTRISSEGYEANFRFLDEYHIAYQFGRVSPEKETLLTCLSKPYTVTIRMVSDFLTYDRVFSQTSGASHFVNILAYDKARGQFFIVDGDVPSAKTGCFSGWIDEADILAGWRIKQGELLQMDISNGSVMTDLCRKVRDKANQNVKQGIEMYLTGKVNPFWKEATGEQAILCMAKQLGKYVKKGDFNMLAHDANFRLRVDGFLGMKNFLLEKLIEQENPLREDYEDVIQEWSKWCMLLLKCGILKSKENFARVYERLEEVVAREREVLQKLM